MLSLVVITYNMRREAPRTLRSLAAPYQQGVSAGDYEVIVVDNDSTEPLDEAVVTQFGPGFRYFFRKSEHPSPAAAINFGVRKARYDRIGLLVDGARIASPGLLRLALRGLDFHERAFVGTLNWHLGPDVQWRSVAQGYDRKAEDELLERCGWEQDGYQLFTVSTLAGSNSRGYFVTPSESNALFLRRGLFDELGGFDERYISSGGGHVNGDFFVRACEAPGTELVLLLGEGTFHQYHGGASTGDAEAAREKLRETYRREHESIRGRAMKAPRKPATYLGTLPRQFAGALVHSANSMPARKTV